MENTNKEIFDKVGGDINSPQEDELTVFDDAPNPASDDMTSAPEAFEDDFDFGELSDQDSLEIQIPDEELKLLDDKKTKVSKATFIIESAELPKPKTRDVDGKLIPPEPFDLKKPDKKGYITKLKITYKDSNFVSYLPNIKWYIGKRNASGKRGLNPWFFTTITEDKLNDTFTSVVSKLYYRFCVSTKQEVGKVSRAQFIKELPGKEVRLEQYAKDWKGSIRRRIDIHEFI